MNDSYFSFYHPIFPILLVPASADDLFETSSLLFWVIVITAVRNDSADFTLLQGLVPAVKKLLWSTIAVVPHTLSSLQAMAILCMWTFPASSMPNDTTLILAGALKSAATHVGLHRPDVLTHYSRIQYTLAREKLLGAVKIWCCTYIAIEGFVIQDCFDPSLCSSKLDPLV